MKYLLLLSGLFIYSCEDKKAEYSHKNGSGENISVPVSQENALVCNLTGEELQNRKLELQTEIFAKIKNIRELPDGYAFEFEHENDLELTLADYLLAERKCCPFFKISYIIHPFQQGLEFQLTGSVQVKKSLRTMIKSMKLNINLPLSQSFPQMPASGGISITQQKKG